MSKQSDKRPMKKKKVARPITSSHKSAPPAEVTTRARDAMKRRRGRVIEEEGQAHEATGRRFRRWNEIKFFSPKVEDKIQHWFAGDKLKQKGVKRAAPPLVFRLLPGLSSSEPGSAPQEAELLPARNVNGAMNPQTFRPVQIIDKFGSNRTASFIPHYHCTLRSYEKYESPTDNPYYKIMDMLGKDSGIPKNWRPLNWTRNQISDYFNKSGIQPRSSYFSPLMPTCSTVYMAYALIYNGFNNNTQKDFTYAGDAYGSRPEHGLQIVSISATAGELLAAEYKRADRERNRHSNDYYWPDPAHIEQGTLNYVWLTNDGVNPVDGEPLPGRNAGYGGSVSKYFYPQPGNSVDVDLALPDDFVDWYYDNWIRWSDVLSGTVGPKQVYTIADVFPELKAVAKRAWSNCPELMEAWEVAFGNVDYREDYDFHDILMRKFGPMDYSSGNSREDGDLVGRSDVSSDRRSLTGGTSSAGSTTKRSTKVPRPSATRDVEEEDVYEEEVVEERTVKPYRPQRKKISEIFEEQDPEEEYVKYEEVEYEEDEYGEGDEYDIPFDEEEEYDIPFDEEEEGDGFEPDESAAEYEEEEYEEEADEDEEEFEYDEEEEEEEIVPPPKPVVKKKVVKKVVKKKGLLKKLGKQVVDQRPGKKVVKKKSAADFEDFDTEYDEEDYED